MREEEECERIGKLSQSCPVVACACESKGESDLLLLPARRLLNQATIVDDYIPGAFWRQ